MRIDVKPCSDFNGTCIEIWADTVEDAFDLGVHFQEIIQSGKTAWIMHKNGSVRLTVPLINIKDVKVII